MLRWRQNIEFYLKVFITKKKADALKHSSGLFTWRTLNNRLWLFRSRQLYSLYLCCPDSGGKLWMAVALNRNPHTGLFTCLRPKTPFVSCFCLTEVTWKDFFTCYKLLMIIQRTDRLLIETGTSWINQKHPNPLKRKLFVLHRFLKFLREMAKTWGWLQEQVNPHRLYS